MTNREMYLKSYDSLPDEVKQAMRDLWDTGINDSGVWVRFRDVEATVGKIVLALRTREKVVLNSMYGAVAGKVLVYSDSESFKEAK